MEVAQFGFEPAPPLRKEEIMIRKLLTFVLPIALAACASGPQEVTPAATGAASMAKAERPEIKVGDKWVSACTYGQKKFNSVTVVTSVDQSRIKATRDGKALALTLDLNEVESSEFSNSDGRALSFPLEVGKQWKATNQWVNHEAPYHGSEQLKVRVVGYAKVKVPAGEFDAFKLRWDSSWMDNTGGTGTTEGTYWYAPAVRGVVKLERSRHWDPDLNCELTEFQLQP